MCTVQRNCINLTWSHDTYCNIAGFSRLAKATRWRWQKTSLRCCSLDLCTVLPLFTNSVLTASITNVCFSIGRAHFLWSSASESAVPCSDKTWHCSSAVTGTSRIRSSSAMHTSSSRGECWISQWVMLDGSLMVELADTCEHLPRIRWVSLRPCQACEYHVDACASALSYDEICLVFVHCKLCNFRKIWDFTE